MDKISNITIKEMEIEDLDECQLLVEQSTFFRSYGLSGNTVRKDLASAIQQKKNYIMSAHYDGKLCGFAWLVQQGAFDRNVYLKLIVIDEQRQRCGFGRALMNAAEEYSRKQKGLMLLVTESNLKARSFYESLGYKQCGLLDSYVKEGINECIYYKSS